MTRSSIHMCSDHQFILYNISFHMANNFFFLKKMKTFSVTYKVIGNSIFYPLQRTGTILV